MSEPPHDRPPHVRKPEWKLDVQVLLALNLLAAVWIAFYFWGFLGLVPYGMLLYPAGLVAVLVYLVWRRRAVWCALIVLFLSPFSFYLFRGIAGHLLGR